MSTPLTTSDQVAAAELATAAPLSDLLAATQDLVNFTLPADGLSTAVADSEVLEQINAAHAPLLAAITGLPASVHSLALLLEELLPAGSSPAALDHLTLELSSGSVVETASPPTLTLGAYSSTDNSVAYTGTLNPANAFSSSDTSVATVDATTGEITLQGPGTTTITRTAGSKTVSATLTVTAEALTSTPSSLSGTAGGSAAALVITDQDGTNVTAGCTFASSDETIAAVDSFGAVTYVADGSARITATHTATGETVAVGVTVSSVTLAAPLARDDMGYVSKAALMAIVQSGSGGGQGDSGATYSGIVEDTITIQVDDSEKAKYRGFNTVRYDFDAGDNGGNGRLWYSYPGGGTKNIWAKYHVKFKNGFTTHGNTAGIQQGGGPSSAAYKYMEYTLNGGGFSGSGRLEITNTDQYQNYFGTSCSTCGGDGGQTSSVADFAVGPNIDHEWDDEDWYDYIWLTAVSEDGLTRTSKWWLCKDGDAPVLMSTSVSALDNGGTQPKVDTMALGWNYNQLRDGTVGTLPFSLWRGPWDTYDASVYTNPYNVPTDDFSDVASLLGSNPSLAAEVVTPEAPGALASVSNASVQTSSALTFPVTLNDSGNLPYGLAVRLSVDNGSTWIDAPAVAVIDPVLGESIDAQVAGLAKSTEYTVQLAALNPGGQSEWSSSVTGTTLASDPPAYTTGLVLDLDASQSADVSTDGAGVGLLTDLSATGLNFVQATSGAKPNLRLNSANGLPLIEFSSGTYMTAEEYNAALASTAFTMFIVMSVTTGQSTDRLLFDNSTAGPRTVGSGWGAYLSKSSSADLPSGFVVDASGTASSGFANRSTTLHVCTLKASSSLITSYVDGTVIDGSGFHFVPNTTLAATLGTLASNVGTLTTPWKFARLLVYNTALGDTDRALVEAGLKAQWGTP